MASGFFSPLTNYLWKSAGFCRLRGLKELDGIECLSNPTVILLPDGDIGSRSTENYTDPQAQRPPPLDAPGRFHSVTDFHDAYKSGKLTPTAVAEALLPLIQRDVEAPTAHATAFLQTRVDLVKAAAEASTARYKAGTPLGVLDGVPIAVKDAVELKGYKKTFGSNNDYTDKLDRTSWCVTKWEEQGAVILGKLNMHEIGFDTTNNNPIHGTPLNPHNEHYYTGGSSGGSAYAVGSGLIPFALGGDGGGSIRIPSSFCGVFGLKPSHDRVSARPTPNDCPSNGVYGPIAGNMADLEIAYRVMAAPDPEHPISKSFAPPARHRGDRKKTLGIYKPWFDEADEPVRQACQKALNYFTTELGYELVDVEIPMLSEGQTSHTITIMSELSTANQDLSSFTPANKLLLSAASCCQVIDYMQAQKVRHLLMQHLAHLFQTYPGMTIVTPTSAMPGWHIKGGQADLQFGISDGASTVKSMRYIWIANFTGLPSLTFPAGYADPVEGDGKIPIGLLGTSEWGSEDALIEFGYDGEKWLYSGLEGGRRRPKNWVDVLNV